jgi:hypothetical protein
VVFFDEAKEAIVRGKNNILKEDVESDYAEVE